MPKQVLLVEPDATFGLTLQRSVQEVAHVEYHVGFETARAQLLVRRFDFLVTNLRLGAYNGLHLVYLAAKASPDTRTIVYGEVNDVPLAREAQTAGAFFELTQRLPYALPAYVGASLPRLDRRNPTTSDRRRLSRGGRRAADVRVTA